MAATPTPDRTVDIGALDVHVLLTGSYASMNPTPKPPTAYMTPLMTATPRPTRASIIDAFVLQVPLTAAGLKTQAAAFEDPLPTVVRRRLVPLNAPAPVASGGPPLGLNWLQVGAPPRPFALVNTQVSVHPPHPPKIIIQ